MSRQVSIGRERPDHVADAIDDGLSPCCDLATAPW